MKIRLILSLLLLTIVSYGQMQMTSYTGEPFNYVSYITPGNKLWVIFQPGHGGASFTKDQLAAYGYGRLAQKETLPFNLLIVQAKKGTTSWLDNYTPISSRWSETFKKLGITHAALTGHSLGGKETIRQIWVDHTGIFIGFVALAGDYPYGPEAELKAPVVTKAPVLLLAGTKDTSVSWWSTNTVNTMITKVHPGQSDIKVIPDASHGTVLTKGYNINDCDGADQCYEVGKRVWNFFVSLIPKDPPPIHCPAVLDTIHKTAVFVLPDSSIYKTTIQKQ